MLKIYPATDINVGAVSGFVIEIDGRRTYYGTAEAAVLDAKQHFAKVRARAEREAIDEALAVEYQDGYRVGYQDAWNGVAKYHPFAMTYDDWKLLTYLDNSGPGVDPRNMDRSEDGASIVRLVAYGMIVTYAGEGPHDVLAKLTTAGSYAKQWFHLPGKGNVS